MSISALAAQALAERPSKAADHAAESRVLVELAGALAASPSTILDKLSQAALSICRAHSAGFSLLTEDGSRFYWASIAGRWACHVGGGTPRDFGPCGMVLDHDCPMLFWHPETQFPYLAEATPAIDEGLLLPFYVNGKAVGTIWVISHDASVRFDAEDLRVMTSLATFASAAYQALQKSERQFQRMLDALPAAVYATDASGKVTHYNRAAIDMSGRTPCAGTDQWCVSWKLYHPDGTPMPHDSCPMALSLKQGRELRGAEIVLERPDGTRVTAMPFPTLLRDAEGRVSGAINMIVDIRERKAAELALMASEERLRALIETTPECVKLVARDGTLLQMNASGLAMVGARSAQEVVGSSLYELIAPEHRQSFIVFNEAVCSGHSGSLSFDLVALDGTRRHMETRAVPFKDSDGGLVHLAITRDVTEQRRAEAEREQFATQLREREAWLLGQGEALEAALNGASLETSLGVLVRTATGLLGGGSRGGFYLANAEGTALRHVVGMPESYARAVEDFPIGPNSVACGVAIHTGQPNLTSDVNEEPHWAPMLWLAQQFDYRACWSIPILTSAGKFCGTFAAYWREPHAPNARELDIVTRVSQAAGIIISRHTEMEERRRAEEALRRSETQLQAQLRDTQLLQNISAELIQEENVEALYQKLVDAAAEIMRSDFASMQMLYPERGSGGELLLLGSKGFPPEAVRFWQWVRSDSNSTCGIALRTGGRVIEPDVANSTILAGTQDQAVLLESGIRAVQSTPLFSRGGRLLGMITTHWRKPHLPGERDLRLLDVLARQAADLIERKQAEEARSRQAERMQLLWEAAATLLTADDPDAMLRALLAKIGPHLGVDVYFNYLVNDSGDALRLASCEGVAAETAQEIARLEFGEAICGTVALQRQPIVAARIHESDDPKTQLVKSMGIRAYACNPLLAKGRLLGTLSFASRNKDAFDSDEVAFLSTLCHYVTVAYERLRLLNELKEADRRKDEFLATLAHELRNPLAPIRNAAQVLRLKGSHEPDLRWTCDLLERQVDHLSRLIDDLLDIARITSNKLELRRQRVELAEIVTGVVQSSRPLIAQCGHELTVTLPPDPIYLDADVVRLAQVFLNLLNNAAKYTERGGRIRLAAERRGDQVVVSVQDTGVGIPADKLPYVFELFFQADRSLEKSHGGLGVGLSLVRQLVHLHGGRVEAHSDGPGKGSEFIVSLPAAPEVAEPAMPTALGEGRAAGPARRIVIVDDNRDAADSLAMLLRHAGNEVHTAYDGVAGVAAVERLRPDVVLLDLGMPILNGYDACRRIRAQPWCNGTMLIALTGWGQEHDRSRSREAGFDAHLVKPVDLSGLSRIISSRAHASHHELVPRSGFKCQVGVDATPG